MDRVRASPYSRAMDSVTAASRPAASAALAALAGGVLRPFVSARTWLAVAYLLASLPIGVAGFMVLTVSLPFAVVCIALALSGIPMLAIILAVIDLLCRLQRACTTALAGVQVPAPPPEPTRERQVLALMAEGRANAAIAATLVVGLGAVEKHITTIFAKLGLPPTDTENRRVLAVLAYLGT
jgi:DNA-binding NarL/FixJ family response regulator